MKKITFIDLFSGCGGLSEGFYEQGYHGLAHVEWESPMVNTLRNRLVQKWNYSADEARSSVIKFDIQKTEELLKGNWSDETKNLYLKENNEIIENINIKEICFGNKDIILSEKEFYFNKSNEPKTEEQPKVKELEKRSSQIDKFNKRYGL